MSSCLVVVFSDHSPRYLLNLVTILVQPLGSVVTLLDRISIRVPDRLVVAIFFYALNSLIASGLLVGTAFVVTRLVRRHSPRRIEDKGSSQQPPA